ncbi:class I SAM-dependent RNA methyltransferase [Sporolactobacillus kofuensis]|uniref:Class I SAM-dependent RNA methyltransferase n=1 Tax=Sporolactobacillus kofuensis TaxID=269672 RepID=A0ABW1WH45_9BACL|nr:class I SAM-dependent RNA methyltransferase [Sporolactobacillus kofuensis]MCO7176211.1 class I SAM-dependent RNA methyltransferase [Sporolactobacillus kofuensis]
MSESWSLIATTAMGLEAVAARELKNLGYEDLHVENGRILFQGGPLDICRCNLWLRTVDRLRLRVGTFKATTFDSLFEQTKALPWAEFLPENATFPVTGKSHKSMLHSVPDCQAIVKKAIVESMKANYHKEWFQEDGPMFKIQVALEKDCATISIDTSGDGLHKRGYRQLHNIAPLKETLASAMILLSRWTPDRPFVDPFCGSGTLPIEAAMIGQNIAPGFNRSFVSESWPIIGQANWERARDEAENMANYEQPLSIMGSDIDHNMIELSEHNAREAGFSGLITFKQMQVADFTTKETNGCMIGNPPYGERMGEKEQIIKICQDLGELYKKYKSWSFYFITSFEQFEASFGRPASKKRKLYNGRIRTDYFQYFGKKHVE